MQVETAVVGFLLIKSQESAYRGLPSMQGLRHSQLVVYERIVYRTGLSASVYWHLA